MTVFKAFLKVCNKCKIPILIYTVILIFFGAFNIQTNDSAMTFSPSKPDVVIINSDEERGITKHLVNYIEKNSEIIDLSMDENSIRDALFYRDVNYVIYIPKGYRQNFLNGDHPQIEIQSTGDYQASLADMMLKRYLQTLNAYRDVSITENELIQYMDETLAKQVDIEMTTKLNTTALEKAAVYYNFTNYCILAGCIYVICLVLSSFKNEKISKRTMISSMNYKKYNRSLLFSNILFSFVLWLFYVLLSFVLIGSVLFSMHGLFYILNSFVFMICAVTIAFLLGNLKISKVAINGIVNVIALGSSFLCGAFVPIEFLPDVVLKIAHILPSYWFIQNNELLKHLESFSFDAVLPIFINMLIILAFAFVFVVFSNVIGSKKKQFE